MKPKAIIVICEPRSVYDTCFLDVFDEKTPFKLVDNLGKVREVRKADILFYASVSAIGSNNENASNDYDFNSLHTSHIYQSYVTGFYQNGIPHFDESLKMGPCFYQDGITTLNTSKGFGAYFLESKKDSRSPKEKVMDYIDSITNDYDVVEVIFMYDYGYSESLIDWPSLKEKNIPTTLVKPARPFAICDSSYYVEGINTEITSERAVAYGVNDCLERHLNYLEKNITEGRK